MKLWVPRKHVRFLSPVAYRALLHRMSRIDCIEKATVRKKRAIRQYAIRIDSGKAGETVSD